MNPFGDLSGQTLGKYELRAQIGAGGMGAVYRAYQADLKRLVAVKVLPFGLSDDSNYIERFNREAAVSAALEHAHIVPIYDYGTEGKVTFVVMRLLTGGNLSERIKIRQQQHESMPSLREITDLLKSLASALDYAHSQHVIHRDIKPTNVMFDNQGSPFLVDFGIAKLMQATTGLTEPGQAPGTPVFMAPEQWKGKEIGPATDQYALGIMTYLLVTGRVPFEADTPYQIMHKHFHESPTPPKAHRSDLPEAVTQVLNRVLEKEPQARFPTVTDFAYSFERAIVGQEDDTTNFFVFKLPHPPKDEEATHVPERERLHTQSTLQDQPTKPQRNKLVWSGLAALAAVIVIAVALILLLGDDDIPLDFYDETVALIENATRTSVAETANAVVIPPTQTETSAPNPTSTETRLPTDTFIPTLTAREAAVATNQVEETINAERTAIFIENATATATLWTYTPLPMLTATETPTDTIEQGATREATESDETIEITMWIRDSDEQEEIRRAVDDFNVTQNTYRIVETSPSGNASYDENIAAAAKRGELACIFDADGSYAYPYMFAGDVIALDDYFSPELMADLLPSVIDQGTVNGHLYGVGRYETSIALWGNRSYFDAAGLDIPTSIENAWTLEEFNAILAVLAQDSENSTGFVIGLNMHFASEWYAYALSRFIQSFGGDIIDRDTLATAEGFLNSPESIAALEWLQNLFENGYATPSSSIALDDAFSDGSLPLMLGGIWAYYAYEPALGDDLVAIPMPNFGSGSVTSGGSMQWMVSSNCEHPEGAIAFLEFAYQPDYLDWITSAHAGMPPTYSLLAWFDDFQPDGALYLMREQVEQGIAVLRPKSPVYAAISDAIYNLITDVAYGSDPTEAANAAVETIDAAIQQYSE